MMSGVCIEEEVHVKVAYDVFEIGGTNLIEVDEMKIFEFHVYSTRLELNDFSSFSISFFF